MRAMKASICNRRKRGRSPCSKGLRASARPCLRKRLTNCGGLMAAARYAATEQVGVGGRFEYFADPDGVRTGLAALAQDINLVTTTLTLDYSPAKALTFKLDGRLDWSNKKIFPKGVKPVEDNAGTAVSATLGAVISTN